MTADLLPFDLSQDRFLPICLRAFDYAPEAGENNSAPNLIA
jgi:hypothetical protein